MEYIRIFGPLALWCLVFIISLFIIYEVSRLRKAPGMSKWWLFSRFGIAIAGVALSVGMFIEIVTQAVFQWG